MQETKSKKLLWTTILSALFGWFWILAVEYSLENFEPFINNTTNQLLLYFIGGVVFWFTFTRMILLYEFRATEGSHKRGLMVYAAVIVVYGIIKFLF